ncbi:hypothetical protein ACMHYB_23915 [Sorangium sp. So ce1128]
MPGAPDAFEEASPAGERRSCLPVVACSAPVRLLCLSLQAVAALNLFYVASHIAYDIVAGAQTAPPLAIALSVAAFSGVPLAATALLRRMLAATVDITPSLLLLTARRARFEIPLASVSAIRPFSLPLPGSGLAITMRSGRRFRYRLLVPDPGALLEAIGDALPAARSALGHPSVAYARARADLKRRHPAYWLLKFGLLPLVLTVILFQLHQHIVYGGAFGQYHLVGPAAYLRSFGIAWTGTTGGLVVLAGVLRLVAELLALLSTWALPSRARLFRGAVEIICQIAYFGVVPAFVAARLLL